MPSSDELRTRVLEKLEHQRDAVSDTVEAAFLDDLCNSIRVAAGKLEGVLFAPHIDAWMTGPTRAEVLFPRTESFDKTNFSFVVRPVDKDGRTTERFYGVPMIVGRIVPLKESGLLDRKITSVRIGKNITPETDKLVGILRAMQQGREPRRVDQDLLVDMTYADVLDAYGREDLGFNRDGIRVQRVAVLVPSNPAYTTEGAGFISNTSLQHHEGVFLAYAVGERLYRGRPIVFSITRGGGPRLVDHNTQGEDAYFNIASLASIAVDGTSKDIQAHRFTVLAVPYADEEARIRSLASSLGRSDDYSSPFMRGSLGVEMGSGGMTLGMDIAAFSTGRVTGTQSKLVGGNVDRGRRIGIIDAEVYTCSPDTIPDLVTRVLQ